MKAHTTEDILMREKIREALKENDNYCPCVVDSKNKIEYRCPCKDFRENTQVGETCYCGLYIKDEM